LAYNTNNLPQLLEQSDAEMGDLVLRLREGQEQIVKVPPAAGDVVSKLPRSRVLHTHRKKFENDMTECGICCDRLIDGVALIRLPCGHIYHIQCGVNWLSRKCTCPECRYEVETNDPKYELGRVERMKERKTISCSCPPSVMHECFFQDPSKILYDQCHEIGSSDDEEANDIGDTCSDTSTCEATNHEDHKGFVQ